MDPSIPTTPQQPDMSSPTPTPTPVPPPAPQSPVPPIPQQPSPIVPSQPVVPSSTQFSSPQATSTKAPKKRIFAIVAILVAVLIAAGALLYIFVFSDAAQSKKVSNGFMSAVTTNDITKAMTYINEPSADETKFITSMAESLQGNYKLGENKLQNGKGYFLYSISGAKNKYARTILDKESGSWKVNNLVSGNDALRLVPGDVEESSSTKKTEPVATATLSCLAQADYKWINYNKEADTVTYDDSYDPANNTFNKTTDMFFKPDSTNEDSFLTLYDDVAEFATKNASKQWKLRLEGSVYGLDSALASSKKLANDRSEKVKSELVKRGVPANRIVIDPPKDYSNEPQTSQMVEIYRRVVILVDPTCTTKSGQ